MKTFKDILNEVAEPRGGDEKRFKDKHVVAKYDHPSAEEDQFVAKTKKKKREADLEAGKDEEIYEEDSEECPECGKSEDECECDDQDDDDDEDDMDEAAQPKWKVAIGKKHYNVVARNTAEASKKAQKMADKERNSGVPGKVERLAEEEMTDAQMKKREEIVKGMKDRKAEFKAKYGDKAKSVMYATATKMAMKESAELAEQKTPFVVVDTADDNKVVGMASDERNAKMIISSSERPPMSIKDKSTLKIVKTRKKQNVGRPLVEEVELTEDVIADLKNIVKRKSAKEVKFSDGDKLRVDMQTANILLKLHDSLNSKNQQTFANAVNKDETGFMKMVDFAYSKVK